MESLRTFEVSHAEPVFLSKVESTEDWERIGEIVHNPEVNKFIDFAGISDEEIKAWVKGEFGPLVFGGYKDESGGKSLEAYAALEPVSKWGFLNYQLKKLVEMPEDLPVLELTFARFKAGDLEHRQEVGSGQARSTVKQVVEWVSRCNALMDDEDHPRIPIVALVEPENVASNSILTSLGFEVTSKVAKDPERDSKTDLLVLNWSKFNDLVHTENNSF